MSDLLKAASGTDAQIEHDWTTVQPIQMDAATSRDLVVLGVTKARSENSFGRRIGPEEARSVPKAIEKHVLLVEDFLTGVPGKLYVDGAGLVGALCRAVPESGIGWPTPAESANWGDDERAAPSMLPTPALICVSPTGTRKAEVGEYTTYSVTRVRARDAVAFIAECRQKHRANKAEATAAAPAAPAADPIPF